VLSNATPQPVVAVSRIDEPTERSPEIDARFHQLRERALEILGLIEQAPPELAATVRSIEQPGALADFVTGLLDMTPAEKQELLETVELLPRLDLVITRLAYRHEVLSSRMTSGSKPARRWRGGSANSCCASSSRRSRRSSANPMTSRPSLRS
jgi:ATP-dependent Lon protease